MLFYCEYSRRPGVNAETVRQRVLEHHHFGHNHQDRIEAIYALAEEGTGFVVAEFDDLEQLRAALAPYRDLMDFTVRVVDRSINYEEAVGLATPWRTFATPVESDGTGSAGGM